MSEPTIRLAVLQLRTETDYALTMEKAHRMLAEAATHGTDIAVLPEMFSCPYSREYFKQFAARGHEETVAALSAWAKEFGLILGLRPRARGRASLQYRLRIRRAGAAARPAPEGPSLRRGSARHALQGIEYLYARRRSHHIRDSLRYDGTRRVL